MEKTDLPEVKITFVSRIGREIFSVGRKFDARDDVVLRMRLEWLKKRRRSIDRSAKGNDLLGISTFSDRKELKHLFECRRTISAIRDNT